MTMEYFELPYNDWYDEEGRIYKDILIKNFNTIEAKINEIAALNIKSFTTPDLDDVVYPDVTLASENADEQILNLKSFLTICDLIRYPLNVKTNGNNKVTSVEYFDSDYSYKKVTNSSVVATEEYPYLYINFANQQIIHSNSASTPTDCSLVGVLKDNRLITNKSPIIGNVDFVNILCHQPKQTINQTIDMGNNRLAGTVYNNQTIGYRANNVQHPSGGWAAEGAITQDIFLNEREIE